MRGFMKFAWLPVIALTVSASTLNLNTGSAAWQVKQTSGPVNSVPLNQVGAAVVLTGTLPFANNLDPAFAAAAWANPFGGAVWIGQLVTDGQYSDPARGITCTAPCGAQDGFYEYTYTFNAANGGNLILSGATGDNGIRLLTVTSSVSGSLFSCTQSGPGVNCAASQNTLMATTGILNWAAGLNGTVTITARVENQLGPGRNPSGLIIAGSANINDGVPEPSTYAMFGLGGAAMLFARLRRK